MGVFLVSSLFFGSFLGAEELLKNKESTETGFVLIPGAFYKPETKVGFLGALFYYFNVSNESLYNRQSYFSFTNIYTINKQFQSTWANRIYLEDLSYILYNRVKLINYPDKFYEIGNQSPDDPIDYTNKELEVKCELSRLVFFPFYAGLTYEWKNNRFRNIQSSLGNEPAPLKTSNGNVSGLGFALSWDTRDNFFFTKEGAYHHLEFSVFDPHLNSDFSFQTFQADFRYFFMLHSNLAMAFQYFFRYAHGDVPFQKLSSLGGDEKMRGIFGGRYRDNTMMVFQVESRLQLSERIHLVSFGGVGDVSDGLKGYDLSDFKIAVGGGLRYRLTSNGLNIRGDAGYSKDNVLFYLTVMEAF